MRRAAKTKWSNFHITINPNMRGRGREAVHALRDFCREMVSGDNLFEWLRQYRDGERREFDAEYGEAEVEVRAKLLRSHPLLEIAVRGGEHSDIDVPGRGLPDSSHLPRLEHSQQTRL